MQCSSANGTAACRSHRHVRPTSPIVAAPVLASTGTPNRATAVKSGRFTRSGDATFTAGNPRRASTATSAGENGVASGTSPRRRTSATTFATSAGDSSNRRSMAAGSASLTRCRW